MNIDPGIRDRDPISGIFPDVRDVITCMQILYM